MKKLKRVLRIIILVASFLVVMSGVALALTYRPAHPMLPVIESPIATPTATHLVDAQSVLASLSREIIPAQDSTTVYGVTFSQTGYNTLIAWNRDMKLSESQRQAFAGLHVRLPCCAFAETVADETQNCACGHHVALYGLAKKLLVDGWDHASVQSELIHWERYFFPKEALIAELVRRAAYDPAMARALEELKTQGGC